MAFGLKNEKWRQSFTAGEKYSLLSSEKIKPGKFLGFFVL